MRCLAGAVNWGDGLDVDPGSLWGQADQVRASHDQLRQAVGVLDRLDVGDWRGQAAQAERAYHRGLVGSFERQLGVLPPAAAAVESAASAFEALQATQRRVIDYGQRWQYRIGRDGWISSDSGFSVDPRRAVAGVRLQCSVVSLMVRINLADVELAGKLGVADAGAVFGAGVAGVGSWIGGDVAEGLSWASSDIRGPSSIGRDLARWIAERAAVAEPAWRRYLASWANPPRWVVDLLTKGEIPQAAEVAATWAYLSGQAAGVLADFFTGKQNHIFDDGHPWVGEITQLPDDDAQVPGVGPFTSTSKLLQPAIAMYETHDPDDPSDRPSVQVTAVQGSDGQVRYVVSIPGTVENITKAGGWTDAASGLDWAANLKGVGYGTTSATQAAMGAVDKAIAADMAARGLGGGRPQVLLTGHSQGGIVAANMAADSQFSSRYDVRGIVSAGSPQQTIPIPANVPVYNFQNPLDPVPRTDLGGINVGGGFNHQPNVHNVVLSHTGSVSPTNTHAQDTYMNGVRALEQGQGSVANTRTLEQMNAEFSDFYNGKNTAYRVPFGREGAP